jgi:hypothetical protein
MRDRRQAISIIVAKDAGNARSVACDLAGDPRQPGRRVIRESCLRPLRSTRHQAGARHLVIGVVGVTDRRSQVVVQGAAIIEIIIRESQDDTRHARGSLCRACSGQVTRYVYDPGDLTTNSLQAVTYVYDPRADWVRS